MGSLTRVEFGPKARRSRAGGYSVTTRAELPAACQFKPAFQSDLDRLRGIVGSLRDWTRRLSLAELAKADNVCRTSVAKVLKQSEGAAPKTPVTFACASSIPCQNLPTKADGALRYHREPSRVRWNVIAVPLLTRASI